jgi:hypothetical protein
MAFVWVQQWVALPIIPEGHMGDPTPASQPQALDTAATGFARDGNQSLAFSSTPPYKSQDNGAPFYSQLSAIPHSQFRPDHRSTVQLSLQYPGQEHGKSPLNMSSMAGALPEYGSVDEAAANSQAQQSVPRSLSSASSAAYHLGQNQQMGNHTSAVLSSHTPYGAGFATGPYQQAFVPSQGSQQAAYSPYAANQSRSMQTTYQGYPQASQYMYYPAPYGLHGQFTHGYAAQGVQGQGMYDPRTSIPTTQIVDRVQENGFAVNRMSPGVIQGDNPAMGSMITSPFVQAPGETPSHFKRTAH